MLWTFICVWNASHMVFMVFTLCAIYLVWLTIIEWDSEICSDKTSSHIHVEGKSYKMYIVIRNIILHPWPEVDLLKYITNNSALQYYLKLPELNKIKSWQIRDIAKLNYCLRLSYTAIYCLKRLIQTFLHCKKDVISYFRTNYFQNINIRNVYVLKHVD